MCKKLFNTELGNITAFLFKFSEGFKNLVSAYTLLIMFLPGPRFVTVRDTKGRGTVQKIIVAFFWHLRTLTCLYLIR